MRRKKAQVWISAVLYILIAAVAMVIILQAGIPILNNMRDRTSYTKARDTMIGIDRQITNVALEGEGSQRIIPIDVPQGKLVLGENLKWQLETSTKVLEPRTKVEVGNVYVYTNIDVKANESNAGYYILENDRIRVRIDKQEDEAGYVNVSKLIQVITLKDEDVDVADNFDFKVGNNDAYGRGYTELSPSGDNERLDKASVIVHMLDSYGLKYDLLLTLESQADYITTELQSVER